MNFRKLFTAFALVCAGVSPAQTVSAPLTLDPAVRYGVLENGLTYYIRQNNYPEDQVEFYIAQKVGSMQEKKISAPWSGRKINLSVGEGNPPRTDCQKPFPGLLADFFSLLPLVQNCLGGHYAVDGSGHDAAGVAGALPCGIEAQKVCFSSLVPENPDRGGASGFGRGKHRL